MKGFARIAGGLVLLLAVPLLWSGLNRSRRARLSAELFDAVQGSDQQTVSALLETGADPKSRDSSGATALLMAESAGNAEMVAMLASRGADVNAVNLNGRTALHRSAARGDLAVLQALLDAHASIAAQDARGRTALMVAAEAGRLGIVETLLQAGASPDQADHEGHTALMLAAKGGFPRTCGTLLDGGAQVNARDRQGQSPLFYALEGRNYRPAAGSGSGVWYVPPAPSNPKTTRRVPAAAEARSAAEDPAPITQLLSLLLARGADAKAVDLRGRTILDTAVARIDDRWIAEFRRRGVRASPSTELLLAAARNDLSGARKALALHPDVNAADSMGRTSLHWAIIRHSPALVELLLQHGADPSGIALELAIRAHELRIVKALLQPGAANNQALFTAVTQKSPEFARLLVKSGAKVNVSSPEGHTALMIAAQFGRTEAVRSLLNAGADFHTELPRQTPGTALGFAMLSANPECVEILLQHGARPRPEERAVLRSLMTHPDRSFITGTALAREKQLEKVKRLVEQYSPETPVAEE